MMTICIKSAFSEFLYEVTEIHAHTGEGRVFANLPDGEVRELTDGEIFVMSDGQTVAKYDLRSPVADSKEVQEG